MRTREREREGKKSGGRSVDGASQGKKRDAEKWIHKRREEEMRREVVGNGGRDPDAASLMIFLFFFPSSSYVVSVISGCLKGGFIRVPEN